MSTTAEVINYVNFSGDIVSELALSTGELANSPAAQQLTSLSIGNNTITPPDVDGFTLHGVAIIPPNGNTEEITLKGVNGDTGLVLSSQQATVLQFGSTPPTTFVLNVEAAVDGLRLVWF